MMNDTGTRDTGQLAIAIGAVAAASAGCLLTFSVVKGPFGTLNDIGNATTGLLSAALGWRLRGALPPRTRGLTLGATLAGAALTVIGSALVVSGTTGWFLAGLVSSVGFVGVGAWLVVLNRSSDAKAAWPARLRSIGLLAGSLMATGIVATPGIVLRLDSAETAPTWVWIAFLGWFGTFVVYPVWAVWMGRVESRLTGRTPSIPARAVAERAGK